MRRRCDGFSLVELMIAVTLAMVTVFVVMQVLFVYEGSKRTVTGGNDAEINAAIGLFQVEREVRMSGAGLTLPSGLACGAGINVYYDDAVVADGAALTPLTIIDGGTGPDALRVVRTDSSFGPAPTRIVKAMPNASSILTVSGNAGLTAGDLFLVAGADGDKICTLMQMSSDPQATGNGWNLNHHSGEWLYNPPNPDTAFTVSEAYDVGDVVINLGRFGLRTFEVLCNDGEAPGPTNSCDLVTYDALAMPAPALADVDSLASQVIDVQAQYGVAPVGSQAVSEWVDATGADWTDVSAANQARIKAVRLAIVTRGQREREAVSPAALVLWDAGQPTERTRALSSDEQLYRYKVLRVVVPLVNVIWADA
jgi:type IV pilus assembly protein PilW